MTSLQSAIRFTPRMEVQEGKPLVACVTDGHYWVYLPQAPGSPRNFIISRKGTLKDLYEFLPKETPVLDVQNISVKVFLKFKPKEYDRNSKYSLQEFIQALKDNGAKEI